MGMLKEFREFAVKGNMVDLAVGVVIGSAFGKIVSSLVTNLVMPPLNLLTSRFGVNFNELAFKVNTLAPKLNADGSIILKDGKPEMEEQLYPLLNYGPFLQTVFDFIIIAFAVFMVVKMINNAKKRFESEQQAAPAAPAEDVVLLREIRDALKR
jgi:large conductance mechanosensitive channel